MTALAHTLVGGILALLLCSGAAAAEVAVIVAARLPVTSLTASQVADIYLGRSNRFPDGTPAVPCDLAEGSPLRKTFYEKVVGKTSAQMKAHWSKLIFTGRGQPPREVANSEQAKKLVVSNPGTVCYVEKAAVDSSVTAVLER